MMHCICVYFQYGYINTFTACLFTLSVVSCLKENPSSRLSAEDLLDSPWLGRYGAVSAEAARSNVFEWVQWVQHGNPMK